jgi:serine/threonine-protein kinase
MAEVFLAEMPGAAGFVKEVALKLVRPDAQRPELAEMFVREAQLASRLNHANIVQVFEFDQVDGRYYIAMELVRGRSLAEVMDACRGGGIRLGVPRAVAIAVEVAKALSYAHRLAGGGRWAPGQPAPGVVHRDVSPQNILISHEGEVKLTDFGIARALWSSGRTNPGVVKGKAAYMAPEQARGEAVDARVDVFGLGVVLWELLTGRRLFARDSEAATLAAVLEEAGISPPSAWNELVTPELDGAVLGALARDPAQRTATAEALGDALEAVLMATARTPADTDLRALMGQLFPERDRPGPRMIGGRDAVTRTALRSATALLARGPSRAARLALLVGVVAAGGGLAWMLMRRGPVVRPEETAATAPPPVGSPAVAPPQPAPPPPVAAPATPAKAIRANGSHLFSLPVPSPESGEGILAVNATPYATVFVDGERAGDTPRELRLGAGKHRLRAVHPTLGSREAEVAVEPGKRVEWRADLTQ